MIQIVVTLFVFNCSRLSSKNSPSVIIVEGWAGADFASHSIDLVNQPFDNVIVTGTLLPKSVMIAENSSIFVLTIPDSLSTQKTNVLNIHLSGSPVNGLYPAFMVSAHSNSLLEGVTSQNSQVFTIELPAGIDSIEIKMTNDTFTHNEDRNLFIENFQINDITIPARSPYSFLKSMHNTRLQPLYFGTYAEQTAYYLRKQLPDSITIVAINSTHVEYSRTLTSAKDAACWMIENGYKNATIITPAYHSKRTLLSYRKASPRNFCFHAIGLKSDTLTISEEKKIKEWMKYVSLFISPARNNCKQELKN